MPGATTWGRVRWLAATGAVVACSKGSAPAEASGSGSQAPPAPSLAAAVGGTDAASAARPASTEVPVEAAAPEAGVAGPPAPTRGTCPPRMVSLPGGTFKMGEGTDVATVRPFCVDVTEVTVDAYTACVSAGQCTTEKLRPEAHPAHPWDLQCGGNFGRPGRGKHPINCVSWEQSARYCEAQCKRLPSEEEWEWAARGGPLARKYPWGDTVPEADSACFAFYGMTVLAHNPVPLGPNPEDTCAVGAFPKGDAPGGIHDLAGDVEEWTSSAMGKSHVTRGGSWSDDDLSASARGGGMYDRLTVRGFRCVSDVPAPDAGPLVCSPPPLDASAPGAGDASLAADAATVEASAAIEAAPSPGDAGPAPARRDSGS